MIRCVFMFLYSSLVILNGTINICNYTSIALTISNLLLSVHPFLFFHMLCSIIEFGHITNA